MASGVSGTSKCEKAHIHAAPAYKKSSGHHCAVFGCENNQRNRKISLSTVCEDDNTTWESCRCGVFRLHRFPSATKNDELRRQWIIAINRKNYEPNKSV
uniref:THAP-type domain-containing protein n=1 Tax=Rhipicephalus appendiculatus TaxID=34631 RepID=A0A131YED3_RHIAP